MNSELSFAMSLSNTYIRTIIRPFMEDIKWNSQLAKDMIKYFTKKLKAGDKPRLGNLRSYLANKYIEEEIEKILSIAKDYMLIPKDDIGDVLDSFEEFYSNKCLSSILTDYKEGKNTSIGLIKKMKDIKSIKSRAIEVIKIGDLDVNKVIEEELGGLDILPTSFEFVKKITPWQGYLRGQLVTITAEPGVGKSLFLLNEAINFAKNGYKVYLCCLGDLFKLDYIIRSASIIKNVDFNEVSINSGKYFDDEVKNIVKNIFLTVTTPGVIDIAQLADFIESDLTVHEDIDVVLVDYDANLNDSSKTDSLYEKGKDTYNTMVSIVRPKNKKYRLGMIASQPKIIFWGKEELPKESLNESSGKQAVIDLLITIGRSQKISNKNSGIMKAAKARRGKEGIKTPYILLPTGRFQEIDFEEYARMKQHSSDDYTIIEKKQ